MAKFSEIFRLNLRQPQLDFVDIDPTRDTELYIDPYAISIKDDAWSRACDAHIVSFFDTALEMIRNGREAEAKSLLNGLREPNETCLGLSRGNPQGRGVSGKQAIDLYESLAESQAARTGLLSELAECDLFIPGIGRDKISDITTNIIRRLLITYTQEQCTLLGIALPDEVASGRFWDPQERRWRNEYVRLPVITGKRIILVPKQTVRRTSTLQSQEYYNHFVLNFLEAEELRQGSSLVHVLKKGGRKVYRKELKQKFPFSKEFLAQFTAANPHVLQQYKEFYKNLPNAKGALSDRELYENFDEPTFCNALIEALRAIPPGRDTADRYHSFMVGTLEFLFWPDLIYPKKETPINEARKRIDITYTNAAIGGFFYRAHTSHQIASAMIMVECKNYGKDPNNPEIDQLAGRFSINRGRLGFLMYRTTTDYNRLITRCRDVAAAGNGFILPLGDQEVIECLTIIRDGARSALDQRLEALLGRLID